MDVSEIAESFAVTTTSQLTVSSTPPSHSTQYEPKTMLGKQMVQLLDYHTNLTNYKWQLRNVDRGIGHTSTMNKQQLAVRNTCDSEFKFWQRGYIASQKKHPNPEDIPPEVALTMRKISTIIYHEWKLKLSPHLSSP